MSVELLQATSTRCKRCLTVVLLIRRLKWLRFLKRNVWP